MNTDEAKVPDDNSDWQAIDIFLFSNGQQYSPPRKYHLRTEELNWWDATLNHLARSQLGLQHSLIHLYTTDGRRINGPLELKDGMAYVAVEPPDIFNDAGYDKYLVKASRSWEKRQAKKAGSLDETGAQIQAIEHALCCLCPEREDSVACGHEKPCCICPEKEGMITIRSEQSTMIVTERRNIRMPGGNYMQSIHAKTNEAGPWPAEYGPRIDEHVVKSGECRTRPADNGKTNNEREPRSGENGKFTADIGPRMEGPGANSAEHGTKPNQNGRQINEHRSKSGEIAPPTSETGPRISGQVAISSERGSRPEENGARLGERRESLREHGPRTGESGPGEYGAGIDQRRHILDDRAAKWNENQAKSDEHELETGKSVTQIGEHDGRIIYYEARPVIGVPSIDEHDPKLGENGYSAEPRNGSEASRQRIADHGEISDRGCRAYANGARGGEYEERADEHKRQEAKYEGKRIEDEVQRDVHGNSINELGGRGGEHVEGQEDRGGRDDNSKTRGVENGGRASQSGYRGFVNEGRASQYGGRGLENGSRRTQCGSRGVEHSRTPGENASILSDNERISGVPRRILGNHGIIPAEPGILPSEHGRLPNQHEQTPGELGRIPAELGIISGINQGRPSDQCDRVGGPEARLYCGGVDGAAAFPHVSEAQQHVRKSSISTGRSSLENKRRLSPAQHPTFKKPTPSSTPPISKKRQDEKKTIRNYKEIPPPKVAGRNPARLSNGPTSQIVGKPKTMPKYPNKSLAPTTVPPPTASFDQTVIKGISTSLTKIMSCHKSIATDSAPIENVIADKEMIVVSSKLYRNPESENTSLRLDSDTKPLLGGTKDNMKETRAEDISNQSETFVAINQEVQTCTEISDAINKQENAIPSTKHITKTNSKVRVTRTSSHQRNNIVAADEPIDDNFIAFINKGDIVNLKLNIEVRNGEKTINTSHKLNRRSRSLTNVTKTEKSSQISIEEEMIVQSKSLQSLLNHEYCRGTGFEGHPKVLIVQCACCGYKNNPSRGDPTTSTPTLNDSKKYFVVLPNPQHEDKDDGCDCNRAVKPSISTKYQSGSILVKKTSSETSLETIKQRGTGFPYLKQNVEMFVVTTTSACQTEEPRGDCSMTKRRVSITEDQNTGCSFPEQSSSQKCITQTQYVMSKNSFTKDCLKKIDTQTQTEWCNILLEVRRHDNGHYSFHLPPLHVLRYYTL